MLPPAPRFALLWAALVYVACTLSLAYPILAGRFLAGPNSDQYKAGYAFREFAASYLHNVGHIPLWNPYLVGGVPYVAGMAGDIFYPPSLLLRAIFPTDLAMSLAFALHLFFAGLFTYLFLRAWRLGFFGALIGGVAYMLGGFVASLAGAGHDGKLYIAALLPLVLWLLTYGMRDGRRWAWGALAFAIGFAVLSPHPQVLQYLLLTGGAFALYLAIGEARAGRIDRATAIRRIAFALGAVILGAAMGAVQFLPVMQYTPWSPRAGGQGYQAAIEFSFPPEELINTYLPQFSGLLDAYWGRNGIHFHSEYIGAVVLMLAGAGLGAAKRSGFVRFWIGVFLVTLFWALGGFTPFYHLVYALVPGSKFFRAPSTIFYITTFCVALLAAYGTDRLLAREITTKYAVGWVIGGVVMALLAASGALTNLGVAIGSPFGVDKVDANAGAVTMGGLRSLLFVVLGAGLMILFMRGRLSAAGTAWLLALVAALDLWTIDRYYWSSSPPAKVIYASNAAVEYLQEQTKKEPSRVYTIRLADTGASTDPFLGRDALMVHRLRQVAGYHGNEIGRYLIFNGFAEGGFAGQMQRVLANPNFWRLANMSYVLTNSPDLPIPNVTKVLGPVTDAEGTPLYLFRLPGDNPAAWVAPMAVKAEDERVLPTVLNPQFDPATVALFDTSARVNAVDASTLKALPTPLSIRANVTRYDPGHITVQLDQPAPEGSALLVSENYYPGWQAVADGKPAATARADFTLIGVALPAGARNIDLTFQSATYEHGKLITLIAVIVSLVILVAGIVAGRVGRRMAGGGSDEEMRGMEGEGATRG
jgi:hypothetical protein